MLDRSEAVILRWSSGEVVFFRDDGRNDLPRRSRRGRESCMKSL